MRKAFHEEAYGDYKIIIYKNEWYTLVIYNKEGERVYKKEGCIDFTYALKDAKELINIYHKQNQKREK